MMVGGKCCENAKALEQLATRSIAARCRLTPMRTQGEAVSNVRTAVHQFADEAARYAQWARFGTDQGELAARTGLVLITRLYLAALLLPSPWNDGLTFRFLSARLSTRNESRM